ncbi:relaxin receptor 1-like [Saccostrea cucullata]|uniref:relaxin receptor 1-like n=1 Tax=Saccostrea cuccullata TaxID=36930 RepID=UPI002ED2CFB8
MDKAVTFFIFCPFIYIASSDSLVDCEFDRDFCYWNSLEKDYDFLQIDTAFCGFGGEIKKCRSTNFIAGARHWQIASLTNNSLLLKNIPRDLRDKAKKVAYSDNTHSHQHITTPFQQDFTMSLLYSPIISASFLPRCLKYRYLLTGKAHISVSYLTASDDIYSGTPLIAHAPLDIYNFTYGFINLPFINDIRMCDENMDCSDGSDETFCYDASLLTPNLNCSSISFPTKKTTEFDDNREKDKNDTIPELNTFSTKCNLNISEPQERLKFTVKVQGNGFTNVTVNDSVSIRKTNISALFISYDDCAQLINSSVKNLYKVCTLDVVTKNISPFLHNFTKCGELDNKNTSSDAVISTKCGNTYASMNCSQQTTEDSFPCYRFCPSGCNCSEESNTCVKQDCPALAQRIFLKGVECDRVDASTFKTKHIFQLEILNAVIRSLEIRAVGNISLHSIVIKDSSIGHIDISQEPSTLKSIYIFNTSLSSFEGTYFSATGMIYEYTTFSYFSLGIKKLDRHLPQHLVRAVIRLQPRILDISGNSFENMLPLFLAGFDDIVNISHNKLMNAAEISSRVVDLSYNVLAAYSHSYSSVEVLYLNNNRLQSAWRASYLPDQDDNLRTVDLSYNYITVIHEGDLLSSNLIYLNLSRNLIHTVEARAFSSTTSLITLDLSYNEISQIIDGTFSPLGDLKELFLQGNPFQVVDGMFTGLYNLQMIQVRHYTICCAKPNSKYKVNCITPGNEISSCENLIAAPVLNVAIWYIALIAVFGNVLVLIYHLINLKNKRAGVNSILMIGLSFADLLMGIYLYVIAITNLHYTGQYGLKDHGWRHSLICIVSGIIATLSSEASVFIVLLITLERYIVVKYPHSEYKFTRKSTILFLIISWTLSLLLALIPLLPDTDLESFYTQSGVCISLPLSVVKKSGWMYSMVVFVGINFLLFLGIIVGQVIIFVTVNSANEDVHLMKIRQKETSLTLSLFVVVITDMLCWTAIGVTGILTYLKIEVQAEMYGWVSLVVFPINSALHPIFYSFAESIRNKKNKDEKVAQLKKQLFQLKSRPEGGKQKAVSAVTNKVK